MYVKRGKIEYKVSSAGNAPAPSMPQQISVQKKSSLRLPLRRLKDLINRKNELPADASTDDF